MLVGLLCLYMRACMITWFLIVIYTNFTPVKKFDSSLIFMLYNVSTEYSKECSCMQLMQHAGK